MKTIATKILGSCSRLAPGLTRAVRSAKAPPTGSAAQRRLGICSSLLAVAALSSLSGCVVDARPYPARSVYYGPTRTVYVEPARPVYVRRYY